MLKRLLATLLSVTIVLSACVTVLNVSAETVAGAPIYNAVQHEIITESSAVTTQSAIGLDKTVYGSFNLSVATSGTTYNDRVLLYLGHFTHNWVAADGTAGDTRSGNAYLVFNRHTDGIDIQMTKDNGNPYYWGADYKKFAYPDGTKTFTGPYEVAYSLSASNLTVWMNDTVVIDYDYNSWSTSSGAQFTTQLDSFVTGHQAYGNPAVSSVSNYKVWIKKEMAPTPVYDEELHEIVTESSAVTTQSAIGLDKTVYGSFSLSAATSGTAYNDRVLLYLGHFTHDYVNTDSTTGSASGNVYLVFNRHTDGMDLQMLKDDGSMFYWGYYYKKFDYPDGTKTFTGPYEVTYSLSATNLTVWMNDIVVTDYDYNSWSTSSGAQYTTQLDSFVTGHQAYAGSGGNPVSTVSNYKVWKEKEKEFPIYDEKLHEIITESSTVTTQSAIGLDKTVYGSFNLSAATSGTAYNDRVLLYLGHFTHDYVTADGTAGDTRSGNVYLVFNRHTDGLDLQMIKDDGNPFYWGANYKKFDYPDGTKTFTGPYEVAYSLSASNLTVWMNDTIVIDYDYNSWSTSSGAQYTTKLDSFVTGHQAYGSPAVSSVSNYKVWMDKEIVPVPEYNDSLHKIITEASTVTSQSKIPLAKTVYGSLNLSAATDGTAYNDRVLLYLGSFTHDYVNTDSTTGSVSGTAFLVFNRHTEGLDLQMIKYDGTAFYWGANYKKFDYPDGTKNFTGPYEVAYSLSATNLTVWMNDTVVIDYDYNSWANSGGTQYTTKLDSFATGCETFGSPAVASVSNYKIWTEKAPAFNADTDTNLMENANGAFIGITAKNNGGIFTISNIGVHDRPSASAIFRKYDIKEGGTMYQHATLKAAGEGPFTDDTYDGAFIIIGAVTASTGKTGYLAVRFTNKDGIDFQIIEQNGTGVQYIGAIAGLKYNYPDTNSFNRGATTDYDVTWVVSQESISMWVNDTKLADDIKWSQLKNSSGVSVALSYDQFVNGVVCVTTEKVIEDFYAWCANEYAPEVEVKEPQPVPEFNSNTHTDLTESLKPTAIGENSKYELTSNGYKIESTDVGSGEGTDSGVMFGGVSINTGGTLYYHALIKNDRTIDTTSDTAEIYSSASIRLARAIYWNRQDVVPDGYLDISFTEGDGIDTALRDENGVTKAYIGGQCIGLKNPYPDTSSTGRSDGDLDVYIAINQKTLSMWVNGVNVINNYNLYSMPNWEEAWKEVAIQTLVPGVMFREQIGSVEEFKVWAATEDVRVDDEYDPNDDIDCLTWEEYVNSVSEDPDYNKIPEFDDESDKNTVEYNASNAKNTSLNFNLFGGNLAPYAYDKTAKVVTNLTIRGDSQDETNSDGHNYNGEESVFVTVARVATADGDRYLAFKFTAEQGWYLGLAELNSTDLISDTCIKTAQKYSDNTLNMPSQMQIVTKTKNNKISIWLDDTLICIEYTAEDWNSIETKAGGFASIGAHVGGDCYTITGYTYTNSANYGRLGDINGDCKINLLDVVAAKKVLSNVTNYEAFNSNVIKFDDTGSLNAEGLAKIVNLLLNSITEEELYND